MTRWGEPVWVRESFGVPVSDGEAAEGFRRAYAETPESAGAEAFALAVSYNVPGTIVLETYPHAAAPRHHWVFLAGRHRDRECTAGVEDWRKLPVFRRWVRTQEETSGGLAHE